VNERVASWVTALGVVLDHPGRSAKFQGEPRRRAVDHSVGERGQGRPGEAACHGPRRAPSSCERVATRDLAAPAAVDPSKFTTEQAKALLPNLVKTSTYTTSYPPSASRHANISTGASQFDGVVILPGQTFSFWELLGPVTVERGYAYAGAIITTDRTRT